MKKLLPAFLLCVNSCFAHYEIDSLYNSRWKVGMKISLLDMPQNGGTWNGGNLVFGIPFTRNLHHSFFNLESGLNGSSLLHPTSRMKGYFLGLPLKIKYDRDGMFLAGGLNSCYCHTSYSGSDYWIEPVSYKTDTYMLKLNFTMGFEKYVGHECEIFVDVFYERALAAASNSHSLDFDRYQPPALGLSLGLLIRGE